jgi:hypothetical protein
MKRNLLCSMALGTLVSATPLCASAAMTPGLYEYSVKMNVPGAPAGMPAQTSQRCLTSKDVDGNKAYEMPPNPNSDCQMKDLAQSGSQFSYKVACTKPQKIDGAVKGNVTSTGMTMDMTMDMAGMSGTVTQSITARRLGDCK